MISEPKFLLHNNRYLLVSVTKKHGEIVDIKGPYQCVGEENQTVEQFLQGMASILHNANHSEKPIKSEDLSDELKEKLNIN